MPTLFHILHGENLEKSRKRLGEIIDAARNKKTPVIRFEAKKLNLAALEETLGSDSLFEASKCIVIEELHSLPRSKNKNLLIKTLAAVDSENMEIVLWEKRKLTATMLKIFPAANVEYFRLSKALFSWLESFGGNPQRSLPLLKEAIHQESAHFAFVMLIRQIRLLLEIKSGGKASGPPFMIQKLQGQARLFSLKKLFDIHRQLLEIDRKQKTSRAVLTLEKELDLLTMRM